MDIERSEVIEYIKALMIKDGEKQIKTVSTPYFEIRKIIERQDKIMNYIEENLK